MKHWKRAASLALLGCLSLLLALGVPQAVRAAPETSSAGPSKLVYVVPVHHTIESGLERFLHRAFAAAEEAGADHIILDINTLGGRVDSAEGIGELIRKSKVPTVAFVHGKAVSAGSYIALNANQIVMEPGSSIGAAAVVDGSGEEVESPKIVAHWASEMRAAAELRGRNPAIAEGMANKNTEVNLPQINRTFSKGQIVSLTAEEAYKVGYAEKVAPDLAGVLEFIGAPQAKIVPFDTSPAEDFARWLTNPYVMTLLLLIGFAGVLIELFVPGFGLPGILGIAGFSLYFFGHYVAGFAGVEDVLFFIAGIILLVIEIFVPSFGILGIVGIVSIISGVVLAAYDVGDAFRSLGIAVVLAIIVVGVFIKIFKHRGIWNKFILKESLTEEAGFVSQTSKAHYLGMTGKALTPLRPAGTALLGEDRVDVVTEGEFIEPGKTVAVTSVEGTRVVVREVSP